MVFRRQLEAQTLGVGRDSVKACQLQVDPVAGEGGDCRGFGSTAEEVVADTAANEGTADNDGTEEGEGWLPFLACSGVAANSLRGVNLGADGGKRAGGYQLEGCATGSRECGTCEHDWDGEGWRVERIGRCGVGGGAERLTNDVSALAL